VEQQAHICDGRVLRHASPTGPTRLTSLSNTLICCTRIDTKASLALLNLDNMSRFVAGGSLEQPVERDDAWLKAQVCHL
jgi:hypothetical protein